MAFLEYSTLSIQRLLEITRGDIKSSKYLIFISLLTFSGGLGILGVFREPLKIHFGGQANLFDSGRRQEKAALASAKADFPSLPEYKNLLLAAQKQLLELPFIGNSELSHMFHTAIGYNGFIRKSLCNRFWRL